jgi:hypothetical protein
MRAAQEASAVDAWLGAPVGPVPAVGSGQVVWASPYRGLAGGVLELRHREVPHPKGGRPVRFRLLPANHR